MSFIEVQFPTNIYSGTEVSVGYNTDIVALKSGYEHRNGNWDNELRRYDVTKAVQSQTEFEQVLHFFLSVGKGTLNSFRFKDLSDYTVPDTFNTAKSELGTGDGTEDKYQLIKRYTHGGQIHDRTITKPVSGTVKIYADNTEKEASDATYGWSVDTTTGLVTLTTPENWNGVVIGSEFQFDVPVRFEQDWLTTTWFEYQLMRLKITLLEVRIT